VTSMGYVEVCLDQSKTVDPNDVVRFLANKLTIRET
jgi:hypothetical protein